MRINRKIEVTKMNDENRIIPEQLQDGNFRFVLVKEKSKEPVEHIWSQKKYNFEDKKLIKHLQNGGNYGVSPINGMCIVDIDDMDYIREMGNLDLFKDTLTVRSSIDPERCHFYIKCDGMKMGKIRLHKKMNDRFLHVGEVFCSDCNGYVVGPNSIHPNGNVFGIIKDVPIKEISVEIFKNNFISYSKVFSDK